MKKSLGKDTRDFQMFQEYWKIYQDFFVVENTDVYWDKLIVTLNNFSKKYGEFTYGISKEYLNVKSEEYDCKFHNKNKKFY